MRENVFGKSYSLEIVSENGFSGKTYFYTIHPRVEGRAELRDGQRTWVRRRDGRRGVQERLEVAEFGGGGRRFLHDCEGMTRSDRKSQVRQCFGFCTADVRSLLS